MDGQKKKKIAIVTVCSLILLVMVVALVIGGREPEEEAVPEVSSSQKAITTICETTDYKQSCMDSLAGHDSSNPKELIEVAFQAAINYMKEAASNSTVLKEAQNDPRAKSALASCEELANDAINDLQRSFDKFSQFDITNFDDILLDLKVWLSGAITHQETCLDGFEEVPGDAGEKMRRALKLSMEMTSNALAMVAEIATFLEAMGMQSFSSTSRRLLSEDARHGDQLPEWVDFNKRKLLAASPRQIRPNLIVAKDGSGKYRTINEALKDIPKKSTKRFVLYIKEGIYEEQVQFNKSLPHLMVVGDGPTKTRITGSLNFIDGTGTYRTATVAVQADDFIARGIGFENSAGAAKHQAVALRVSADKAIFYNCHMDGYQDTLYVHTYRQFYRDCVISGTIDFIFGDSSAVFQGCTLLVRKPMDNQQNIVTAQGRKDVRQPTGLVLQNCTFKADPEYHPVRKEIKSYLGRPWKEYSRTIIMESFIDDFIQPEGWLKWNETFALETLFYTEFNNRGPAAPKSERVKWTGVKELPPNRIKRFTAAEFLDGNRWVQLTRVPYAGGFIFPVPEEDPNIKYSPVAPEETKDLGRQIDTSLLSALPKKNDSEAPSTSPSANNNSPPIPQSYISAPPTSSAYFPEANISPSSSATGSPYPDAAASPQSENSEPDLFASSISPVAAPIPSIVPEDEDIYAPSPSMYEDISAPSPSIYEDVAASSPMSMSPNGAPNSYVQEDEDEAAYPNNISPSISPTMSTPPASAPESDIADAPQSAYAEADAESFS